MVIRKINESEYGRTQELFSIAFESKMDEKAASKERLEEIKRAPACREEVYWKERWAAFDDSGAMMSFLAGFPAKVRFDGNEVGCTCIGGVSTLPQYRGRGAIAGCLQQHLEDSYHEGHVISYLYPFSTLFYRKFGYELCAETVEWSFETATIPFFSNVGGEAVLNEGNSELAAIRQVYDRHMENYNLSFVREDCDWNSVIAKSPAVENRFTYVWKNELGIPKGVICFSKKCDAKIEQSTMLCDGFYFVDEEGLRGLLNHIRSYCSHIQRVKLPLPKDAALERVLPEVSGRCKREIEFTGMGRIINAEQAFRLAKYRGDGQVSLKLTDPCVIENNRIFKITFKNGQCVQVEDGKTYDEQMNITTFSRLILGNCSTEDIQSDVLKAVFYPKKMFICDFF